MRPWDMAYAVAEPARKRDYSCDEKDSTLPMINCEKLVRSFSG